MRRTTFCHAVVFGNELKVSCAKCSHVNSSAQSTPFSRNRTLRADSSKALLIKQDTNQNSSSRCVRPQMRESDDVHFFSAGPSRGVARRTFAPLADSRDPHSLLGLEEPCCKGGSRNPGRCPRPAQDLGHKFPPYPNRLLFPRMRGTRTHLPNSSKPLNNVSINFLHRRANRF